MSLRVGVVGAGGFGQAIARASARHGHDVVLWSRQKRSLPEPIRSSTAVADMKDRELIFLAAPARHATSLADQLGKVVDGRHLIVHISRGLIGAELKTITTVLREHTAARRLGALAGPLVADALAEGRPSGAILGTGFPEVTEMVREALGGELRLYDTKDVVGVQLASATVGFLTVVLAFAQASGAEPGTLAVLATRGMVEVSRIGQTLGANEETFMGLAGLGDLIAAVAGDERAESRLGRAMAQGGNLADAVAQAGQYVEGIEVARHLMEHARRLGLETPISSVFVEVSNGRIGPDDAIRALMGRRVSKE
ncbi:MAG: NAD(P)-binding domain-containing protein [Deltaproteobacteria bacterium]|nr:NAD(P)-binding domain-containing protein [Deltaproteobacteria bacterium]